MAVSDWADTLREYARRVAGRDDSWKKHALCGEHPQFQGSFLAGEDEWLVDGDGQWVTGYQAQKRVVEQICIDCKVQWECARWGVEVNEEVGVYAITTRERRWLIGIGDRALGIIDRARISETPVQVAVRHAHYPSTARAV
jgi:hypothetical protein